MAHSCDGCTACCTSLAVQFDDHIKPANTECENCLVNACGIYRDRPRDCKRFECAYLSSQRAMRWRLSGNFHPPRSNAIIAFSPRGEIEVIFVDTSRDIHFDVKDTLREVAAYVPVHIIEGDKRWRLQRTPVRNEFISRDAGALIDQAAAIKRAAKKRA